MLRRHHHSQGVEVGRQQSRADRAGEEQVGGTEGEPAAVAAGVDPLGDELDPGDELGDAPRPDGRGGVVADVPGDDRGVVREGVEQRLEPHHRRLLHQRVGVGVARPPGLDVAVTDDPNPGPRGGAVDHVAGEQHAVAVRLDEEHRDHPEGELAGGIEQGLELGEAVAADAPVRGHEGVPAEVDADHREAGGAHLGEVDRNPRLGERLPQIRAGGRRPVGDAPEQGIAGGRATPSRTADRARSVRW